MYGVQLTSTVKEVFDLDEANGNNLWRDVLNKYRENLKVEFYIKPDGKSPPVHYTKASGNLIFGMRITLERKARWVKYGIKILNMSGQTLQVYYHVKALESL